MAMGSLGGGGNGDREIGRGAMVRGETGKGRGDAEELAKARSGEVIEGEDRKEGGGRRDRNGEEETDKGEWGQGDGEGGNGEGGNGEWERGGATGRGRRGKKREDFTDGYDGMPG